MLHTEDRHQERGRVIGMKSQSLFKWKHYQSEIILLTMRWYLKYTLSLRNVAEMMEERGLQMAHTTIMRWVHEYGPQLEQRLRRHLILQLFYMEVRLLSWKNQSEYRRDR
jgi:hypothetical protein